MIARAPTRGSSVVGAREREQQRSRLQVSRRDPRPTGARQERFCTERRRHDADFGGTERIAALRFRIQADPGAPQRTASRAAPVNRKVVGSSPTSGATVLNGD